MWDHMSWVPQAIHSAPCPVDRPAPVHPQLLSSQYHCGDTEVLVLLLFYLNCFRSVLTAGKHRRIMLSLLFGVFAYPCPFLSVFLLKGNYFPPATNHCRVSSPPSRPEASHPSAHCTEQWNYWFFGTKPQMRGCLWIPQLSEELPALGNRPAWVCTTLMHHQLLLIALHGKG